METLEEARRIMRICNACRYCEGFCAVFPAMEKRLFFEEADLTYLANLCHDCRGCYYACQYAPPHEFAVNVPQTFAKLRGESYARFAWPDFLSGLFRRNGLAVGLVTAVAVTAVVALVMLLRSPAIVFATHVGDGAFYDVVPYELMVFPASAIAAFGSVVFVVGAVRFWRHTRGASSGPVSVAASLAAARDALRLTYLGGGSHGCNYPDERFSFLRRRFHHLVFYGFLLDFAATTVAAVYHHVFHLEAPYSLFSLPVVLGSVGGVALLAGTGGLLYLKWASDPDPAEPSGLGMDVAFLVLLFLTSLTGLLLLSLRETPAMGTLLAVHLGVVAGLFLSLPYGKLVHAVYRYLALVRHSLEEAAAHEGGQEGSSV